MEQTGTSIETAAAAAERRKKAMEEMQKKIGQGGSDLIRLTKDKKFKLPNGVESAGPLSIVVLDFVAFNAYFDRPYSDKPENRAPAACFALGSVKPVELVPSAKSPDKQNAACVDCWANQFKSAANGSAKACGNHYLIAAVENTPDPESPLYILRTGATTNGNWERYVNALLMSGRTPVSQVTEVWFDPDKSHQVLKFGNPKPNLHIDVHEARIVAAQQRLLQEPDVSGYEAPAKPKPKQKN